MARRKRKESRTSSSRVKNVVRRRRARRAPVRRRAFRRARSQRFNPVNIAIGAGLVAVGEPILDSFTDRFTGSIGLGAIGTDAVKAGIGFVMAKKMRSPIAKSAGMALMVIGIRNIVRNVSGGGLGIGAAPQAFAQTVI